MIATYKFVLGVLFIQSVLCFSLKNAIDPNLYLVKVIDHDALCLDGSPAAYYISKDGDPKKILLAFEGGGWCTGANSVSETLDDCLSRSKNGLGSSKGYPNQIRFDDGLLSSNDQNNFKNWTRVFLKYCDGSGHQGTKKNPVSYKGTHLYFRGHNATVGKLNSLEKQNKLFSQATHVAVSGASAGGLAVFLWTNYIKERVKVGKVWAIPDSGIFLDSTNVQTGKKDYRNMFKNLMSITNVEIDPPVPECAQKFRNQPQSCMFATNLAQHIKAPMYIIQSLYDSWSVPNILGVTCIDDSSLINCDPFKKTAIEEYHRNTTNAIFEMTSRNPNINGFFAPVCANHVYAWGSAYYNTQFRIPQQSQNSIVKSIQNWMDSNGDSSTSRLIDLGTWPDNKPCAGKTTSWNLFSFMNSLFKRN